MNELYLKNFEKSFFYDNNILVLQDLLSIYYSQKKYPLVYFLAHSNRKNRQDVVLFYEMMALVDLSQYQKAYEIYCFYGTHWLDICHQHKIYWQHVLLFILYFRPVQLPGWIEYEVDRNIDSVLSKAIDWLYYQKNNYLPENLPFCKELHKQYPTLNNLKTKAFDTEENLVSISKMHWKVWELYNAKNFEKNSCALSKIYDRDGLRIYTYKHRQIAASMHILLTDTQCIILDCGCEITAETEIPIPVESILKELGIEKVDALFVSHGHYDHYGSLDKCNDIPCYMTDATWQIIRLVAPQLYIKNINIIRLHDTVVIGEFCINSIPNGHILGSVLFDIYWKNKRIIYTGDFNLFSQKTCKGLNFVDLEWNKQPVDVLLIESTYGKQDDVLCLNQYEAIFQHLCITLLEAGRKLVMPAFAVGRAQELCLLLQPVIANTHYKILVDGLAVPLTEFYQNYLGRPILNSRISVANKTMSIESKFENYDIIIASSGMLQNESTSYQYVVKYIRENNIAVLKTGYIDHDEGLLKSIEFRSNINMAFFDIPLSAHANYNSLIQTLEKLMPDCAIFVHGNEIQNPYKRK